MLGFIARLSLAYCISYSYWPVQLYFFILTRNFFMNGVVKFFSYAIKDNKKRSHLKDGILNHDLLYIYSKCFFSVT